MTEFSAGVVELTTFAGICVTVLNLCVVVLFARSVLTAISSVSFIADVINVDLVDSGNVKEGVIEAVLITTVEEESDAIDVEETDVVNADDLSTGDITENLVGSGVIKAAVIEFSLVNGDFVEDGVINADLVEAPDFAKVDAVEPSTIDDDLVGSWELVFMPYVVATVGALVELSFKGSAYAVSSVFESIGISSFCDNASGISFAESKIDSPITSPYNEGVGDSISDNVSKECICSFV